MISQSSGGETARSDRCRTQKAQKKKHKKRKTINNTSLCFLCFFFCAFCVSNHHRAFRSANAAATGAISFNRSSESDERKGATGHVSATPASCVAKCKTFAGFHASRRSSSGKNSARNFSAVS